MQKYWALLVVMLFAFMGQRFWSSQLTHVPVRTMERIQQEGIIRIGFAVEPPYALFNAEGEPTGCEIEVAKALVTRLGVPRIEWFQTNFHNLIDELDSGRFDVIAAGMFITPERSQRVLFSEPTLQVNAALLVQPGNPHNLHSYENILQNTPPPIKVAVLHGSIEEALLLRIGIPDSQLVRVPDAMTGKAAIANKLVEGLALSAPTIRFMTRSEKDKVTEMAEPFFAPPGKHDQIIGHTAHVFRKTDNDLRSAWNRQLRLFIGTPEHQRLLSTFGFSKENLPGDLTTAEILKATQR